MFIYIISRVRLRQFTFLFVLNGGRLSSLLQLLLSHCSNIVSITSIYVLPSNLCGFFFHFRCMLLPWHICLSECNVTCAARQVLQYTRRINQFKSNQLNQTAANKIQNHDDSLILYLFRPANQLNKLVAPF